MVDTFVAWTLFETINKTLHMQWTVDRLCFLFSVTYRITRFYNVLCSFNISLLICCKINLSVLFKMSFKGVCVFTLSYFIYKRWIGEHGEKTTLFNWKHETVLTCTSKWSNLTMLTSIWDHLLKQKNYYVTRTPSFHLQCLKLYICSSFWMSGLGWNIKELNLWTICHLIFSAVILKFAKVKVYPPFYSLIILMS
jgi:hypothetical protein